MNIFPNNRTETEKGFTLMEVMVSVSIFAIIITVGIGSLLTIFGTLQKTKNDQQTMDSLSFVLDTMTRRIRTGYDYTGDSSTITFKDQDYGTTNVPVTYTVQANPLDNDALQLFMTDVTGTFDITPDNLIINNFSIEITGTDPNDGIQPMVQIHLAGVLKNGKRESPMSLQAVVSQRILDFPASSGSNLKNPDSSNTGTSFTKGAPDGSFRNARVEKPTDITEPITNNSAPIIPDTSIKTIQALNPPR